MNRPSKPNDYDREERMNSTWWSSRRGRGSGSSSSAIKRGRRLTLIDMLLLVVMIGILVPWFLTMDRSIEHGAYRLDFRVLDRSAGKVLKLEISLPKNESPSEDDRVGWMVYGTGDSLLHSEQDLPPAPGEERIFRYPVSGDEPQYVEILIGDEKLVISPVE